MNRLREIIPAWLACVIAEGLVGAAAVFTFLQWASK